MVKFPGIQVKAQEELDRVLGKYQLPTFSDKDSLPFITAIMLESMWWHTTGPVGVYRRGQIQRSQLSLLELLWFPMYGMPSMCQSYAELIGIFRAMLHDKNTYTKPFELRPEWFLKDGKIKPSALGSTPGISSCKTFFYYIFYVNCLVLPEKWL